MIIKIKQFIEKRLKQLFIKNEMNALSFKIENECFMDGSKSKTLAIYSPLKTVYLCIEKVYNTANILQIHGINVDTQKDIIDIKIFTRRSHYDYKLCTLCEAIVLYHRLKNNYSPNSPIILYIGIEENSIIKDFLAQNLF